MEFDRRKDFKRLSGEDPEELKSEGPSLASLSTPVCHGDRAGARDTGTELRAQAQAEARVRDRNRRWGKSTFRLRSQSAGLLCIKLKSHSPPLPSLPLGSNH